MTLLVSILIPAYNAEKWISETIKSALEQTWPRKEIIIVDDGSTDNTLKAAKQFESKIVKVITQENRGASAARNKALSFAQGDYIQWLDADDLLSPDKIEQQLKSIDIDKNAKVLLSSAFGEFYFRKNKAKFIPTSLWQDLEPIEWMLRKFSENIWMNPATWLISRRLTELAGPWDERLSLDDDGEYFCRVVAASEKIKFVPDAKVYYRQCNISSISKSTSDNACRSLFLSHSLCINYLLRLENSERTRTASLKLLQIWFIYFYPEKKDLLNQINKLTHKLGGQLMPPKLSWKYSLIQKIFGWESAKKFRYSSRKAKSLFLINWDRFLYKLSI
ncbi:MAG: glycosyltransferase family 2 protein [Nitrospirae bacterium]|nr:glycosyltransferase family 2 protein [Nitrospirota bacterium]